MATVDFTLEDMHKQTEEIVEQALSKERRHTDGRFDELLLATAEVVIDYAWFCAYSYI